jgi:carboxypeptidase T
MTAYRWILCAALAMPFAPAPVPAGGRTAPVTDGPARVVRLAAGGADLAAARERVRARGGADDFIVWQAGRSGVIGAAPDGTLRDLAAEGIRAERLFSSIAEFQEARAAGTPEAAGIEQADLPRLVERVVVVDLARSKPDAWVADPETVLRANARYVAVLEAADAADPEGSLAAQYGARGLVLAAVPEPGAFAEGSAAFFPEAPVAASELKGPARTQEGAYTSYAEATAGLAALAARYPSLVRLTSAGKSYEGRELWAVKISADVAVDDPNKPDVLFTGLYHAREWIAAEVPYQLALRLPALYESDPRVRFILDHAEVWVMPIVNPDGLVYSQGAPNHTSNEIRLWRKNRRPIDLDGDGRLEGLGVDLNRNHSQAWRVGSDQPYPATGDDHGASDDPHNFQTYRGPAPDSEPEIRAITAFTADPARNFVARMDFHNYGQLVLFPYGSTHDQCPDHAVFAEFAHELIVVIHDVHDTSYTPMPAVGLYLTTGSSTDYAYAKDRQFAFTLELSPHFNGFDLDEGLMGRVVGETVPAALQLADWATGPATVTSVTASHGGTTVFAGRWVPAGSSRAFVIDQWAPIAPGRLDLAVTFSRPLSSAPKLTLRAGDRVVPLEAARGSASVYAADTWTAAAAVREGDGGLTLDIGAQYLVAGAVGFDADPGTIASFTIGSGDWSGLEAVGPGLSYALRLPPGQDAVPVARLESPGSRPADPDGLPSEIFAAGGQVPIAWNAFDDLGVASQSIEYSADGGGTWSPSGLSLAPDARSAVWVPPAGLSSADVLLRLSVVDTGGNVARAVSARPVAVSSFVIAPAPEYRGGKLRIPVPAGGVHASSLLAVQLNGTRIDSGAVRWKASSRRVIVRGTLEELGLTPGTPASVRLIVNGVPTPDAEFVP